MASVLVDEKAGGWERDEPGLQQGEQEGVAKTKPRTGDKERHIQLRPIASAANKGKYTTKSGRSPGSKQTTMDQFIIKPSKLQTTQVYTLYSPLNLSQPITDLLYSSNIFLSWTTVI